MKQKCSIEVKQSRQKPPWYDSQNITALQTNKGQLLVAIWSRKGEMAARLNITLTVLTLCARLCGLYASSVANNKRSSFSIVEHHPSVNPLEISLGEAITLR